MPVDPQRFQALLELLSGRQLIVVSNREPYIHRAGKHGTVVDRPAGGLVAALDPVMQAISGTWVAWGSGERDFEVTDPAGRVRVPPDAPRYTLRRVGLPKPEVDGYYYGYANQALWPLFHNAVDKARFRRRAWTMYQVANQRFAAAVLEESTGQDLIWVHDYHLALCPRMLRGADPDLFLMHFWHIPWPAWDVFRICPQSAELLDGLLANDLLVFQHPRHAQHFMDCAHQALGAQVDPEEGGVEYNGRLVTVKAFPISVDVQTLEERARSRAADRWMARFRRRFELEGRSVVLGVDRLDYTKGIPERLSALELFFRRFPDYRMRVVFIQKSAPSRTQIKAYRILQKRVETMIEHLNTTYGTDHWRPVLYLPRPLPPAGLSALYRMADLCVVSSLQDGMNLVAKEFIASQVDERGVLVLSELAGARDELPWALPINPYDVEGFADALSRGLALPAEEKRERMRQLRAYLAAHDIYHWMEQHFQTATRLLAARAAIRRLSDHLTDIRQTVASGRRLALLLDFDGTLAPLSDQPELVRIPDRMRMLLERIAATAGTLIAVVSGRALSDIRQRVRIEGIVYVGNHGLEIEGPDWSWVLDQAARTRDAIGACCERLRRRLRGVPGAWVEDKGLTASVHYRLTPSPRIDEVRRAVAEEVSQLPAGTVSVQQGKKVLEIRPDVSWDKGAAVRWVLTRVFGEGWPSEAAVIYIGDDRTDEDVFLALADPAISVKVGPSTYPTGARYTVRDSDEVYAFLSAVAGWLPAAGDAHGRALSPAGAIIPAWQPSEPNDRRDRG